MNSNTNNNNNSGKVSEVVNVSIEESRKNNKEYYNFKVEKELLDNVSSSLGKAVSKGFEQVVPNLGAAAAGGTAAAAAIKASASMPPAQRLAFVAGAAMVTSAGTRVGADVGVAISKNIDIKKIIKDSPHSDPHTDRIPSPSDDMIRSVLESSETNKSFVDTHTPLETLLSSQFMLNVIILILMVILFIMIFNKYILKYNVKFIKKIVDKYANNKFKE